MASREGTDLSGPVGSTAAEAARRRRSPSSSFSWAGSEKDWMRILTSHGVPSSVRKYPASPKSLMSLAAFVSSRSERGVSAKEPSSACLYSSQNTGK